MNKKIFVYDPTASDKLSSVRGIGRYLQILKENFPEWTYVNSETMKSVFAKASTDKQYNNELIFVNPFFNFLQPPVWTSHDLSLLGRRITRKQIAVIHDLIPLKYPDHFPAGIKGSIYILLNKLALKNYDLIITDSEASKNDIVNILKIKSERLRVVYPCLSNIFLNPKSKIQMTNQIQNLKSKTTNYELQTNPYCLYVGDATWNKNLVNLARAIKIANVNCVFVGKIFSNVGVDPRVDPNQNKKGGHRGPPLQNFGHPWMAELKEFFELTKGDKRFILAGFIPDSELIKLYQQAALNILPSCDEGFGFSFLEAAQFSCPSVLSNIPVLKEISDENALFADPKNPQDLADKIGEIYFNKNMRDKLGLRAKKRSEFFSMKKFKKDFLSTIK